MSGSRCAVFLDRDGVLLKEKHYLSSPENVELFPNAANAVRMLREFDFLTIVVTNQSAIARGLITEEQLQDIHLELEKQLKKAANIALDDILVCPHHPSKGIAPYRSKCSCRKPEPGMLLAAQKKFDLDLTKSFLIGDKRTDIEAGKRVQCFSILVRTGYGEEELVKWPKGAPKPDAVCQDVYAAAQWICSRGRQNSTPKN